jgi:hypothetical protein
VATPSHTLLAAVCCGINELVCASPPIPFASFPASLQSLVAFHLGKGDRRAAAAVFRRTLTLAVGAGLVIAAALLAAQGSLPGVFTQDAAVIGQVALVLPLVAAFLPLDAAASVMDGVLLGSQEAGWLAKTMAVTAVVCTTGLLLSQRLAWPITGIWVVIKVGEGQGWARGVGGCRGGCRGRAPRWLLRASPVCQPATINPHCPAPPASALSFMPPPAVPHCGAAYWQRVAAVVPEQPAGRRAAWHRGNAMIGPHAPCWMLAKFQQTNQPINQASTHCPHFTTALITILQLL